MKDLSPGEKQVIEASRWALLALNPNVQEFQDIQAKFSDLLKTNFENRDVWLRFGLTIALSKCSPQSALQAFNECMRIDQDDPLPAMLAAKLLLEELDEPERALEVVDECIKRCKRLTLAPSNSQVLAPTNGDVPASPRAKSSEDVGKSARNSLTSPTDQPASSSLNLSQASISPKSKQQLTDKAQSRHHLSAGPNKVPAGFRYKDINPLLSKCYLLASIMHAQIYEREPESIKQFKMDSLKESLRLLDLALETNPAHHLAYFHKALHQVKQRTYPKAIDNLRRAIQINPRHIPSMQLLILTLSAMNLNDEALVLCESTLHELEDNLLLLYFKCSLEQRLVSNKGYKSALGTAQYMLKSLRRLSDAARDSNNNGNNSADSNRNHSSTTTISATAQSLQNHQQPPPSGHHSNNQNSQQQQHQPQHNNNSQTLQQVNQQHGQLQQKEQQQQHTRPKSGSLNAAAGVNSASSNHAGAVVTVSPNTTPVLSKPGAGDSKQMNNLFADDPGECAPSGPNMVAGGELSIWLLVAEIFVKVGAIEDAEMCVDEAAIHASGALSPRVMFVRGLIAKARSNLLEAKTFFQSCLALCPRHAMALQQVAHVYYQMGHFATAEKFLKDSLDLDGDCFKTWHYLSLVLIELNQHERASECAKKSTLFEESSPVVPFSTIPRLTLQ